MKNSVLKGIVGNIKVKLVIDYYKRIFKNLQVKKRENNYNLIINHRLTSVKSRLIIIYYEEKFINHKLNNQDIV